MTAYASTPSELVVCIGVLFVQPVFLNHVKDTRYLLICKATDLERFIMNVSTSLVVLCLLHDIIWGHSVSNQQNCSISNKCN